jgi:2-keto-4-pentenoate hydratase/2-oxohepta-3-ene-1,7-dioic acid hydratase in catechol pathway
MRRYARGLLPDGRVAHGLVEGGALVLVEAPFWRRTEPTGETVPLAEVRLLPPCEPRTIVCMGLNFASHLHGRPVPDPPTFFYKPLSAIAGPGDAIVLPAGSSQVEPEGEIVIVIGRPVHRADRAEAAAAVFGVTAGLDVTARDWQRTDAQWWRAKGADTFAVFGPTIATDLALDTLALATRINGVEVQRGHSAELIRDVPEVVRLVSQAVTLQPGDLIYTGTPGEPRPLSANDRVEVEVTGAGVLACPVVAEP